MKTTLLRLRTFLSLAALFVAADAFAGARPSQRLARPILEYSYGDASAQSSVKIDGRGRVEVFERTCCPSNTERTVSTLSGADLSQLLDNVEQAALGAQTQNDATSASGESGYLSVHTAAGDTVSIRGIEPNADPSGNDVLTCNADPAALAILAYVNSLVSIAMPDDC